MQAKGGRDSPRVSSRVSSATAGPYAVSTRARRAGIRALKIRHSTIRSDAHARGLRRERHSSRTRSRHDQSDMRHDAQVGSLPRATGACWQKDGRRQCTRHSARAPRGMNGRMPREQALAERGRERPSGVRRQGTCRVWEGGRSRPRCVVALYRRRRQRTRAANAAARHRRL